MNMKICSVCAEKLPLEKFDNQSTGKLGKRADCKNCRKRFLRSERGVSKSIYNNQKAKSTKRNHPSPAYTEEQLYQWLLSQNNFRKLFTDWVDNNYATDLKPSVDRIDDYLPYTLLNIQLTTVKENVNRYYQDAIKGINTKTACMVDQYTIDGLFIARHHSYKAAARAVGQTEIGNIRNAAEGIGNTAYGYCWRKP